MDRRLGSWATDYAAGYNDVMVELISAGIGRDTAAEWVTLSRQHFEPMTPNDRLNLPVRPVTGLAGATPEPVRPAG